MRCLLSTLVVVTVGVREAFALSAHANPIRKVVELMKDMQHEIAAEQQKEKELFEQFMCICSTADADLSKAAEDSKTTISELEAKIEESTSEKGQLEQEVKGHQTDKENAETDLNKATAIREKEKADHEEFVTDSKFNVNALSKAIPAIAGGGSGSAVLVQADDGTNRLKLLLESSDYLSAFDRRQVLSFLGEGSGDEPAVGQVVGILKQMHDDMKKNLDSAIESEKVAAEGFEQLKTAKDKEIEVSSEAIEAKEKRSGDLAVTITQDSDSLEDSKVELSDAQKYLATLKTQCPAKQKEWDVRMKMRNDEVSALSEAISILSNDEATDVFRKTVPSALVDEGAEKASDSVTGFLQQRSGASRVRQAEAALAGAVAVKRRHGVGADGLMLSTLRSKLRMAKKAGGKQDQAPDFAEVVKMISSMIEVLNKEQDDDEKKKDFCAGEIDKVSSEEKAKQEKLGTITSTIEEVTDEIAAFDDDVKGLEEEMKNLDLSVAQATEQRKKEHAEYSETLSMSEAAIELIGKAKQRLQKFYNPAAPKVAMVEGNSLIQRHSHSRRAHGRVEPVEIPDLPKLAENKGGGVMALMDTITHTLELDSQEAKHAEKTAQEEYVELMSESQETRLQYQKSITDKRDSRATLEAKVTDAKESKQMTYDELNNVHQFLAELHGDCDFLVDNFDIRKDARAQELESLRNAKNVMSGATV